MIIYFFIYIQFSSFSLNESKYFITDYQSEYLQLVEILKLQNTIQIVNFTVLRFQLAVYCKMQVLSSVVQDEEILKLCYSRK